MEDSTQLDPTTLQSLLGNSQTSLIPESLVTMMIASFIILNVLGVLFFVFYVVGIVRKWKVQSAVLDIRKDLVEIKEQLRGDASTQERTPVSEPNRVIAQNDSTEPKLNT